MALKTCEQCGKRQMENRMECIQCGEAFTDEAAKDARKAQAMNEPKMSASRTTTNSFSRSARAFANVLILVYFAMAIIAALTLGVASGFAGFVAFFGIALQGTLVVFFLYAVAEIIALLDQKETQSGN